MPDCSYFLFTDETNKEPSKASKFFIYGGVFVPTNAMHALHHAIEDIRLSHGFRPTDEFKFAARSRPKHVNAQAFRDAKAAVLRACSTMEIRFVACLTLHDIAKGRTVEELVGWGANTVLRSFNTFLRGRDATGVVICDRLPFDTGYKYLADKFQRGLQYKGEPYPLDRILLYASSCSGASHVGSAVDILLGAFRYCVNETRQSSAAEDMMGLVAPLLLAEERNATRYVREHGLLLRPVDVKVDAYREEYDNLVARLQELATLR